MFDLRPNYFGGNEDNRETAFKRCHACTAPLSTPSQPPSTHTSTGDSWTLTGKSGAVSCGVTAPFSWVLVHTMFCLYPPKVCFPSLWKFCNQIPLTFKVKFPGGSQSHCQIAWTGNLLWDLELRNSVRTSQRKAMPKNAQINQQLHSSHMLVK